MDKQKSNSYSSRFNEAADIKRRQATSRPSSRQTESVRRPSGFGTAGQARRVVPAPEPETKKAGKVKPEKPIKEKRVRKEREPGKNRLVLRILLALVITAILASVLMVLIFGGEDTTYHQMPIIERESIAQFEPEATPIPNVEGL